jgi:hypothetical protein
VAEWPWNQWPNACGIRILTVPPSHRFISVLARIVAEVGDPCDDFERIFSGSDVGSAIFRQFLWRHYAEDRSASIAGCSVSAFVKPTHRKKARHCPGASASATDSSRFVPAAWEENRTGRPQPFRSSEPSGHQSYSIVGSRPDRSNTMPTAVIGEMQGEWPEIVVWRAFVPANCCRSSKQKRTTPV